MIELIKYFRILFLSAKISRERLKDFTEDHIQRLAAHNPGGIFTAILTAITDTYNAYYGDLSSESLNLAVQKSKTNAMNESRKNLEKQLSDNEKLIAYTYRDNRTLYLEFYPQGMTEFLRADLPTLETISDRYKSSLADHAADFTPTFVTEYNTVQGLYVTNRAAQHTAMGNVSGERSDLVTTKTDLATQLTKNVLTIALQYVGDESKSDLYFNQGILNAAFNESETKMSDILNPDETKTTFDNVKKPDVRILVKNDGTSPLCFQFMQHATDPVPSNILFTVEAGKERSELAANWGWTTTNKYFNITNYGDTTGSFIVEKE